jgi:hypothetical protein
MIFSATTAGQTQSLAAIGITQDRVLLQLDEPVKPAVAGFARRLETRCLNL